MLMRSPFNYILCEQDKQAHLLQGMLCLPGAGSLGGLGSARLLQLHASVLHRSFPPHRRVLQLTAPLRRCSRIRRRALGCRPRCIRLRGHEPGACQG